MKDFIDIVFDGEPGPVAGRFVEVENSHGQSIKFGAWIKREDGYWVLRIPYPPQSVELAIKELLEMIDGGDECSGSDSRITHVIGILQEDANHLWMARKDHKA